MRARLVTVGLVVSLLTVVLVGCSEEPEPKFADSGPSEESTSAEPSPDPTSSPTTREPESAQEFIRRWERAGIRMQTTGRTEEYASLSQDCSSCQDFIATVKKIYDAGGSVDGGRGRVFDIERVGGGDGLQIFEYSLDSEPTKVKRSASAESTKLPGGVTRYQINLRRTSNSWTVTRISILGE